MGMLAMRAGRPSAFCRCERSPTQQRPQRPRSGLIFSCCFLQALGNQTSSYGLCRLLSSRTGAMAPRELPVRSCLTDGEAIVCDENGVAVYELICRDRAGERAVLSAFDLLELDGKDLRRKPIEKRKDLLAELLNGSQVSIVFNECFGEDGEIVFREACRLGCEGIVSKRLGSIYRRGRSPLWIKVKNPNAPAVKREAEEDWGQ